MTTVLHPVGPLPPSTYWWRRGVAVAVAVVAVLALVWVLTSVAGGETAAGAQEPLTAPTTDAPTTATSSTSTAGTSTTGPSEPADEAAPTAGGTLPTAAPPDGEPASGVAACGDGSIALTAQTEAPEYPVGGQPVFRLVVTNTAERPCTRTLDGGLQQVQVYSADGKTRLWSSDDCFPGEGTESATLTPGEEKIYSVRWAGTTSEPGCEAPREPVPAGDYTVVVGLGELRSEPVPFTFLPA